MSKDEPKLYGLAILAHPDDESFLLGGTTLKFKEVGKMIGVISFTRGEKGVDRLGRRLTETEMGKVRTYELIQACNMLHCECKQVFNYPDGSLDQIDFDQLISEIAEIIDSIKPEIVLTFGDEGISGHKDHITIGKATAGATKMTRHKIKELWKASIPSSIISDFNEHLDKCKVHLRHFAKTKLTGVNDHKVTKIDIRKYKQAKLDAIKAHKSQYAPHLIWPHFLEYEYFEIINPA